MDIERYLSEDCCLSDEQAAADGPPHHGDLLVPIMFGINAVPTRVLDTGVCSTS
jgi:hypothetical protein